VSKISEISIIRIVQDFCFANSIQILVNEFAVFVASRTAMMIGKGTFNSLSFFQIAKGRKDFFITNDLKTKEFCARLYKKIKYELQFCTFDTFYEYVVDYKRRMENGLLQGFPQKDSSEDTLRSTLALYIQEESFLEARCSSGRSDICVPSQKVVVVLWSSIIVTPPSNLA